MARNAKPGHYKSFPPWRRDDFKIELLSDVGEDDRKGLAGREDGVGTLSPGIRK
jgi:hypothetical protein